MLTKTVTIKVNNFVNFGEAKGCPITLLVMIGLRVIVQVTDMEDQANMEVICMDVSDLSQ